MKKVAVSIVIVVAIALIVGFVPIVDVPYSVLVQYQDTETYTETVPLAYQAESYATDDIVLQHWETIIPGLPPMSGVKEIPIKVASVDVRNTDVITGSFTVFFSGFSPMFSSDSLTVKLDLSPGQEKTASCPADSDEIGDWSYSIRPGTKSVEKERPVTRQRTETRYKKVSIFEYLRSRF